MKNVAVVGYGGQGSWHCDKIISGNVAKLSGIYDIDTKRCDVAREKNINVYASFEDVLADKSVDIVVIAVPNNRHKDLTVAALNAGKNVICEKPVEMSVCAFDEMAEASKRAGKLFSVHQNRRFDSDFLGIKSIVDSGEIGEIINLESRVHGSRGIPSDWRGLKECGGGMILDWGVHLIDQILQIITEKVTGVFCHTTHITNNEVDDGFKLTLFFESGKTAFIEVGTYNFVAMPRFYMQCKNGTAIIEDWKKSAHIAKMTAWNEKDILPVNTAAGITKTMAPRDSLTLSEYDADYPISDVHYYYRDFCDAIDENREPMVKLSEVRRVMQVMESAFLSDKTKQLIKTEI